MGARSRLRLEFLDPALESDYESEVARSGLPQLRLGILAGFALWLSGMVLIPTALRVDALGGGRCLVGEIVTVD